MAASLRSVFCRFSTRRFTALLNVNHDINITVVRGKKRWIRPVYKSLYHRRIEQGPEKERHRSEWANWNYESELYAFGRRLGEDFQKETLRTAFIHRSYVDAEEVKRADLGLDEGESSLNLQDNTSLLEKGSKLTSSYVKAYLKHSLPKLPPDGVQSIHDKLLSDESLAFLAKNLGFSDLILTSEFPPTEKTLSITFKAVVGALLQDQGVKRACALVEDLVLTQLVGQCVEDVWDVVNPMGLLSDFCEEQQLEPPEPRLLWHSGSETVLSAYLVGIYSNKQLIGKAPGETVNIAEEMAARDALRRLIGMGPDKQPFKFEHPKPLVDVSKLKPLEM